MKELNHITAGRTAVKALLVVVVLTAGIAGTVGTAAAETIDGKGNDVVTYGFPINDVTLLSGSQYLSIEHLSSVGSMEEEEPLQM